MKYALVFLLLTACSVGSGPPEERDAGRMITAEPRVVVEDAGVAETTETCSRVEVVVIRWDGGSREVPVPLPCQPYDRLRDLPYPQP